MKRERSAPAGLKPAISNLRSSGAQRFGMAAARARLALGSPIAASLGLCLPDRTRRATGHL